MKWISLTEEMRRADAYASEEMKIPSLLLMEAAARSVALRLCELVDRENDDILFLCGVGNNGGDGFACARMMKHLGYSVRVFYTGSVSSLKGDAKTNYEALSGYGVSVLTMDQGSAFNHLAETSEWVVDAMFGTGIDRNVTGFLAQIVTSINELHDDGRCKVISVDIPSGIHGDTGKVMGCAVKADETITFCRLKPGLILYPGCDHAGKVTIADIGIPEHIPPLLEAHYFQLDKEDLVTLIPPRQSRSHKGLYGHLLVVAGSRYMTGAACFSSGAAYKAGAGLVECAIPEQASTVVMTNVPECITYPYSDESDDFSWVKERVKASSTVLAGPGLSQQPYVRKLLKTLFTAVPKTKTLVLDADALNWISSDEDLKAQIVKRGRNTILTPHIGEASRLMGKPIREIMQDPIEAVRALADEFNCIVALKDALTLVAEPHGNIFFNSTGNNGMSTAGSGDVLAGLIAGLSGQGMGAFEAACVGVYLHGLAGDAAAEKYGHYSMTAGDILKSIQIEKLMEA